MRELFEQAILLPEDQRQSFLQAQCGDNAELLQTAVRLVAAHAESRQFLSRGSDGKRYGRYVVVREIGRGSMAIVYEADDPAIGRKVALKVLRVESLDEATLRFLKDRMFREAQSGGMLSHPGIVTVFDAGQQGDETFIAMELVEGQTLEELLKANPSLEWKQAADILRQSAAALDYAHQRGVVHRDIKPANIMIDRSNIVKIADFGIAKISAAQMKTVTGFVFGTPAYMSPEQIQMRKLDGRSDQFALAVVAYQICTGAVPFQADSIASLAHQIVYDEPAPASRASQRLPKAVDSALRRGLAKTPAQRYDSCAAMVGTLDSAMNRAPAAPRHVKTWRWMVAGAAAVLLAGGGSAYRYQMARPHPVAPPPAVAIPVAHPPEQPAVQPPPKPAPVDASQRRKELYAEAVAARNSGQVRKATVLLQQAAQLGEVKAMADLGDILTEGDHPDYENARLWLQKAADSGNTSAMVRLGAMYQWSEGVTKDSERAVYWYNRAVEGHDSEAMYDLAEMYLDGGRIARDVPQAKKLLQAAAALGHANAKALLATLESPGK